MPRGPFSRLQWIGSDEVSPRCRSIRCGPRPCSIRPGGRRDAGGMRHRGGASSTFGLLVPSTSASRKLLAEALQESWRRLGVERLIDAVDFPVFQQRLAAGKFDVYIGAYLDEPSPRGIVDQWTRAGWSALNYGHYANPVIDSLIQGALAASTAGRWRAPAGRTCLIHERRCAGGLPLYTRAIRRRIPANHGDRAGSLELARRYRALGDPSPAGRLEVAGLQVLAAARHVGRVGVVP